MKRSESAATTVGRRASPDSARTKRAAPRIVPKSALENAAVPKTRDDVLHLIRVLHRRGESLRREDVVHQHPMLERAARRRFGAWRDAVEAAGIAARGYERWDKERVVREIREAHSRGDRLAHSKAPSQLVEAGITHFGSWRRAIESAGLNYAAVRLRTRTNQSRKAIIALLREGASTGRTGVGPNGFITFYTADLVRQKFGTLQAAIEAAGLDYDRLLEGGNAPTKPPPRRRPDVKYPHYTDERIAEELRRLVSEQPDMTLAEFGTTNVADAIVRRHETLQAGLAAFGISGWPRQVRFPLLSPDEIVAAIQERNRRGDSMAVVPTMTSERRLVKSAYKRFGTWRAAMRAAGLGAEVESKVWDRAMVRAELNGRRIRSEAIDERAIRRDDPTLWSGIVDRYGDLAAAVRDANRVRRKAASRSGGGKRESPGP